MRDSPRGFFISGPAMCGFFLDTRAGCGRVAAGGEAADWMGERPRGKASAPAARFFVDVLGRGGTVGTGGLWPPPHMGTAAGA